MITLFEPQKRAVEKLRGVLTQHGAAGDWSATGTGKTIMALSLARHLGLRPLVVAPLAAHATWNRWSAELNIPVENIINLERLRTGKTRWVTLNGDPKKGQFRWQLNRDKQMVIIDEVHRGCQGRATITGRMVAMLRPQGIKTHLVSATPFNSPLNMRALGYLFNLHEYSTASFFRFCRAHGCTNSIWHRGLEFDVQSRAAQGHLQTLNERIRDRCVRVSVEDIADHFQNNLVEPWLVSLSDDDTGRINDIYQNLDEELKRKEYPNPLVAQLRARQAAELLKLPPMFDAVVDSVEEGYNVFVALGFRESVRRLSEMLGKAGIAVVRITGDLGEAERTSSVQMFQADLSRVLVGTIASGGASISLHHDREGMYPRTSILSPTYSASDLLQALGRINRAEALSPTVQRICLAAGTIEERIARRIGAKLSALGTLTDADLE